MMRINYIGDSAIREVKRTDMLSRGLSDPGRDLVWTKANSYELDVPNDVGAFLLSYGDFKSDSDLDFGRVLIDAFGGRLLGVAELQFIQSSVTTTMAPLFGVQVEVEATGKPLRVALDFQEQNSTTGQGTNLQVFESLDGSATWTMVNLALAYAGSIANLQMPFSLASVRIPPAGLVAYKVQFARFTSGTASIVGAPTSPTTLSVTEL